jgi:hypothetical protein
MSSSDYNFNLPPRPVLHLAHSHYCYHQQPKGLRSSDRVGPQQTLQPDNVVSEGKLETLWAWVNLMVVFPVSE